MACLPWVGHPTFLGLSFHMSKMGYNADWARFSLRVFLALIFSICIHQKIHKTRTHTWIKVFSTCRVSSPFLLRKKIWLRINEGDIRQRLHFPRSQGLSSPDGYLLCQLWLMNSKQLAKDSAMHFSFKLVICLLTNILVPFSMLALALW